MRLKTPGFRSRFWKEVCSGGYRPFCPFTFRLAPLLFPPHSCLTSPHTASLFSSSSCIQSTSLGSCPSSLCCPIRSGSCSLSPPSASSSPLQIWIRDFLLLHSCCLFAIRVSTERAWEAIFMLSVCSRALATRMNICKESPALRLWYPGMEHSQSLCGDGACGVHFTCRSCEGMDCVQYRWELQRI